MKKMKLLPLIAYILLAACTQKPTNFWDSPNAYLGQAPPGDIPVKFAPALLNDSPFFSMDRCAFSADGKQFYFDRNNTWFSSKDASIQSYSFDGTKWVGPTRVIAQLYAPSFSPDGNTMYLIGGGKGGVSQLHKTDSGWSAPTQYLMRSYGMYDFMMTNSGTMYAATNINGNINDFSCYDIGIMKGGADTTIQSLGKPINTPGFDGDFFIAPDESYMLVSAKEHPDYECEIFISYHKPDGSWTNPKSLGPKINNGLAHRWGEYVTPDSKYLIYSYGHSAEDCALYWVRFDSLLENLRHTNFEPYVKDSIPGQTAVKGKAFALTVSPNTFFDDDGNNTLTYSAALSDGTALPAWLTFDAAKLTLQGTPPQKGSYKITVTSTDKATATAASTFILKVGDK